jgi:hypothetical protein
MHDIAASGQASRNWIVNYPLDPSAKGVKQCIVQSLPAP